MPAEQPRDYAIRCLFDYLAMVEWRHVGTSGGPPVGFTIPRANMHEEKVDDNTTMELPSLVVDAKRGSQVDDSPPLGPAVVCEDTFDGNDVLVEVGLYKEIFNLEVWAASTVKRKAILAGLDIAFAPVAEYAGLSLTIPDYYGIWCWFSLNSTTRYDDAQLGSRRRVGICEVELWVPLVFKVPIGFFNPRTLIKVNNPDADSTTPRELWDICPELDDD